MTPLLELDAVTAGYGDATVLWDVSIAVHPGEVVAIVGANGAGKSTLLSCVAGLVRLGAGRIRFRGADIGRRPAHLLPGDGLALVPEGGRLFSFLSVRENLQLGGYALAARTGIAARMAKSWRSSPCCRSARTRWPASSRAGSGRCAPSPAR